MVTEVVRFGRSSLLTTRNSRIANVVSKDRGSLPDRVSFKSFDFIQLDCQRLVGTQIPDWIIQDLSLDKLRWQRVRAPGELYHMDSVDNVPRLFIGAPSSEIEYFIGRQPIRLSDAIATITISDPSEPTKTLDVTGIDREDHVRRFRYNALKGTWSLFSTRSAPQAPAGE